MAIVISGVNNNDKITANDGTIDLLSSSNILGTLTAPSINVTGIITATSFTGNISGTTGTFGDFVNVGSNIQLGNAGVATATTFVGNLTGNVNNTGALLLQIGGSEKFRVGGSGQLGIGGANYGTSGQVLTSGGSGSAATWSTISGTTINTNADNRVITGSGSANTLNGEANLTFDGTALGITGYTDIRTGSSINTNVTGGSASGTLHKNTNSGQFAIVSGGTGGNNYLSFYTSASAAPTEKLTITHTGRLGINNSSPQYIMHAKHNGEGGNQRIDLHMTNDTTGHGLGDGVQFGYQNSAGAYIWNFENTPIYMATNNVKKFQIHATGSTQIYKGDLLLGPDSVSQMEATIRAWGCSLWFTTIDTNYYHDSGGEYRQFYNKGSFRGDNYLTCYNTPIQTGVGPQNRNFWKGGASDSRAEGSLDISVGYRGAWFAISRTAPAYTGSSYIFDGNAGGRVSISFDGFGNNMDSTELSFHAGSSPGLNSGDSTVGGRLGNASNDSTLKMYAVGVNMENYNAPNSKRAGNHLGISVINEDGTDYTATTASRLSENLINNGVGGGTNTTSEFNWGNRHSNDRTASSGLQFSQLLYFDDVQLNSAQWDYLEHYFKVMYGNG